MKPWLSKAATQLRNQVDDSYRDRQRKSDGWIADDHHKPWPKPRVDERSVCAAVACVRAKRTKSRNLCKAVGDIS